MHEIITLQLGSQANYIGTHFWNTQESYFTYGPSSEEEVEQSPIDHDIHFRAGIGADGSDTYLPRAVIYDFKSEFGTLRKVNELYEVLGEEGRVGGEGVWSPTLPAPTITHPPIQSTPYQHALTHSLPLPSLSPPQIRYWSDYNHLYHHPRSLIQLYPSDLAPTDRSFETFSSGEELFRTLDAEADEGLFDRDVRPLVEEADALQGVQVLVGVEGGWGGFGAGYVERVRDELGKGVVWVWGVGEGRGGGSATKQRLKTLNTALSLHAISPHATTYIPLSSHPSHPSSTTFDASHPWHTSSLQATAIETLTLPSRLHRSAGVNAASLGELSMALDVSGERGIGLGRFAVGTGSSVVGGSGSGRGGGSGTLAQVVQGWDLSPSAGLGTRAVNGHGRGSGRGKGEDVVVFGGYDVARAWPETEDADGRMPRDDDDDEEARRRPGGVRSFKSNLAYPLLPSFPTSLLTQPSPSPSSSSTDQSQATPNLPILASLTSSSAIATWISELERGVSRQAIGFGGVEREDFFNSLSSMREAYSPGGDGEFDEDGDDEYA